MPTIKTCSADFVAKTIDQKVEFLIEKINIFVKNLNMMNEDASSVA